MATASRRLPVEHVVTVKQRARDWRAIIFRGVAVLVSLGLGGKTTLFLLAPWTLVGPTPDGYVAELHRWHHADVGALVSILFVGSLLALAPNPRRWPVLAQFAILCIIALGAPGVVDGDPAAALPSLVVGALLVAAYPAPRELISFARAGRPSLPLLALAVAATVPLLRNAWDNLHLQANDHSQHAAEHHWDGSAVVAIGLILAGFLAASRRPGWQVLGAILGVAYLYLGVAALQIPDHDGSWGADGGILALLAGAGVLALTASATRRASQQAG